MKKILKIIYGITLFLSLNIFVNAEYSDKIFDEVITSYTGSFDIVQVPAFSGATLQFDYSIGINEINNNLYEIKYILLFLLFIIALFVFYYIINDLLGRK